MTFRKSPLVSIITVNFKQTEVTLQLLDSLKKVTYPNYEIIVVDNGSGENLGSVLSESYHDCIYVESKENLGFAGGNNLGIQKALGKYLFFINNDVEVEANFLQPLVDLAESDSSIGMISPKIIYYDSDNTIQYAGSIGINPYTGRGAKIGWNQKDNGDFDKIYETSLGHGAGMLVPMDVIKQVGMLPEIFFLYYEEHDWCEAIKRAGYKVYYCGLSTIFHKESVSVGRQSTLKTYYMARNRVLFIRRNNKGMQKWIALLFFAFISMPKNCIQFFSKRQFGHLKVFLKGVFWNCLNYKIKGYPQLQYESDK
ncbi:MAG: glycosyltransferase family 2 protein [Cytophagales bacterium]